MTGFNRFVAGIRGGVAALLMVFVVCLGGCAQDRVLSHGRFERIDMVAPQGNPEALVLLLSDAHGINDRDRALAQALRNQGALVAMLDTPAVLASFADDLGDGDDCSYPDGDLENLAHYIEAAYALPGYQPPILAGAGAGGALALATLAQANDGTFVGAITTDFNPRIATRARLCNAGALVQHADSAGLSLAPAPMLRLPWFVQQRDAPATHAIRAFVAATGHATLLAPGAPNANALGDRPLARAFRILRQRQQAESSARLPQRVADLPLIIIPAAAGGKHPRTLAIMMSGDGGWAGLDKDIGHAVAAAGIPVVGYDTLRYYWKARSPDEAAHDLARVIRYYSHRWHRPNVLLIGYSRGADVMPFLINRLPVAQRRQITRAAMLGLGSHITFQFEIRSWFGFDNEGEPVLPEAAAMPPGLGLCLYGRDDDDSICQNLDPNTVRQIALAGGHHFDGDYDHIARLILDSLPAPDRQAQARTSEPMVR